MQNRFKFRVWHKPLKQMHYNDFVVTSTGYVAKIYQQDDYMMKFNQQDLEFDKQCVVMQCTGLKDKNGKLIYEADIVEVINCRGANAIVEYNTERAKFKLNGKKFSPSALEHIRNDYFEVIGNIYENLDLLENK